MSGTIDVTHSPLLPPTNNGPPAEGVIDVVELVNSNLTINDDPTGGYITPEETDESPDEIEEETTFTNIADRPGDEGEQVIEMESQGNINDSRSPSPTSSETSSDSALSKVTSRAYQLEMFEESLKQNIIVAVRSPSNPFVLHSLVDI